MIKTITAILCALLLLTSCSTKDGETFTTKMSDGVEKIKNVQPANENLAVNFTKAGEINFDGEALIIPIFKSNIHSGVDHQQDIIQTVSQLHMIIYLRSI